MSKATAVAPANIAFIKYWGRKDAELFLPYNTSISMNLSNCLTTTTVEFSPEKQHDEITLQFSDGTVRQIQRQSGDKDALLSAHIDRIRHMAHTNHKVRVHSVNNFPANAGIASSASGFSALTTALCAASGLEKIGEDKKELSKLIRLGGSVSAARSAHDGFVEVYTGDTHNQCYAEQIADQHHWNLVDIVAIVQSQSKSVSSSAGHARTESSPYLTARLQELTERIETCRRAVVEKDFSTLGTCIEADTLSMHAVMMTSTPPIIYWNGGTMDIINAVRKWRANGLESYFTIDAGANVHVICQEKNASEIEQKLSDLSSVQFNIANRPAPGAQIITEHLF